MADFLSERSIHSTSTWSLRSQRIKVSILRDDDEAVLSGEVLDLPIESSVQARVRYVDGVWIDIREVLDKIRRQVLVE